MIARLGVIDIGGDAGGDIIAGLESDALLVQSVNQPLERIQRMSKHGAAGAALDYFSVYAQLDRLGRQIQVPPIVTIAPLTQAPCEPLSAMSMFAPMVVQL